MKSGIYRGQNKLLRGQRALVMRRPNGTIVAQFDNWALGYEFSHAWVPFPALDFYVGG